mmetsp:Transcript_28958/g.63860  ORF Transcript_28958/g.63860 Transcript_28958/m.63860 type:complete len:129 (+) Transcript_28958:488-874(+)
MCNIAHPHLQIRINLVRKAMLPLDAGVQQEFCMLHVHRLHATTQHIPQVKNSRAVQRPSPFTRKELGCRILLTQDASRTILCQQYLHGATAMALPSRTILACLQLLRLQMRGTPGQSLQCGSCKLKNR